MIKRIFVVIAFFVVFTVPEAKAQQGINSISDCSTLSDVRPGPSLQSPMELCQCQFDSSYCIAGQNPTAAPTYISNSPEQMCHRKDNHLWLNNNCVSCWQAANMLVGRTTLIGSIFNLSLGRALGLGTLALYGICRASF